MRVVQPLGERGSLKWLQRAVSESWDDLNQPLLASVSGAVKLEWLSPLSDDDYAEYRDSAFLERLSHGHLGRELADFWPSRGPQWDGLARSDAGHVILVEAKAHIGEFYSPPTQARSEVSLNKIVSALHHTATRLGVKEDKLLDWQRHFYQYANRLAHLLWMRDRGVDAKLCLVGFVDDAEMLGKTTKEAWQAAYLLADRILGLPKRHELSQHIVHVYPSVKGR